MRKSGHNELSIMWRLYLNLDTPVPEPCPSLFFWTQEGWNGFDALFQCLPLCLGCNDQKKRSWSFTEGPLTPLCASIPTPPPAPHLQNPAETGAGGGGGGGGGTCHPALQPKLNGFSGKAPASRSRERLWKFLGQGSNQSCRSSRRGAVVNEAD